MNFNLRNALSNVFVGTTGGASSVAAITSGTITGLTDFGVSMANNTAMTGFALGTISDTTARAFSISQTWNNSALAACAISLDVTNTSSKTYSNTWADASKLLDLRIGGTTKFAVVGVGSESYPMIRLGGTDGSQTLLKGGTGQVIVRLSDGIDMVSMGFHGTQFGLTVANSFAGGAYRGVIGFNSTTNVMGGGNGGADAFWSRVAAAHIAHGMPLASAWVNQTLSAAGAIVGTTSNGSPTNSFTITGSISTGTGTGGDLKFGVYGTNGASGTAIGTLNTVLTINAARKVLNVTGIPTSSAGLSSGDVYSNAGVLTVV
jgi:hypothetical protein